MDISEIQIVYDCDTFVIDDDTIFQQFNFCPLCGQELECKINPHSFKIERYDNSDYMHR